MKIRIQGNTLRLRLKKSELNILNRENIFSENINFGNKSLKYTIEISAINSIVSSFVADEIKISIPLKMANNWIDSDLVNIENTDLVPKILIEKDFKCTSKGCIETEEEQADSFLNPNENVSR